VEIFEDSRDIFGQLFSKIRSMEKAVVIQPTMPTHVLDAGDNGDDVLNEDWFRCRMVRCRERSHTFVWI
jgi:hypothetical protein